MDMWAVSEPLFSMALLLTWLEKPHVTHGDCMVSQLDVLVNVQRIRAKMVECAQKDMTTSLVIAAGPRSRVLSVLMKLEST